MVANFDAARESARKEASRSSVPRWTNSVAADVKPTFLKWLPASRSLVKNPMSEGGGVDLAVIVAQCGRPMGWPAEMASVHRSVVASGNMVGARRRGVIVGMVRLRLKLASQEAAEETSADSSFDSAYPR